MLGHWPLLKHPVLYPVLYALIVAAFRHFSAGIRHSSAYRGQNKMVSEMAAVGNNGGDLSALYARVSERVENQGREIGDIRSNMNTGFLNLQSAISTLTNDTRSQIANLSNSFNERNKTPWAVLIAAGLFFFTIFSGVGWLAYQPILSATTDLKEGRQ